MRALVRFAGTHSIMVRGWGLLFFGKKLVVLEKAREGFLDRFVKDTIGERNKEFEVVSHDYNEFSS